MTRLVRIVGIANFLVCLSSCGTNQQLENRAGTEIATLDQAKGEASEKQAVGQDQVDSPNGNSEPETYQSEVSSTFQDATAITPPTGTQKRIVHTITENTKTPDSVSPENSNSETETEPEPEPSPLEPFILKSSSTEGGDKLSQPLSGEMFEAVLEPVDIPTMTVGENNLIEEPIADFVVVQVNNRIFCGVSYIQVADRIEDLTFSLSCFLQKEVVESTPVVSFEGPEGVELDGCGQTPTSTRLVDQNGNYVHPWDIGSVVGEITVTDYHVEFFCNFKNMKEGQEFALNFSSAEPNKPAFHFSWTTPAIEFIDSKTFYGE